MLTKMIVRVLCSRKKKTVVYSLFGFGSVYLLLQVVYLNSQFMPLMTLADAESEALRLLRFISQSHYSCNFTTPHNSTHWPICSNHTNISGVSYSIGPSQSDTTLEYYITQNTTSKLFVFMHDAIFNSLQKLNKTVIYRTTIVPNDPADFGRNSYDSKTVNSIMEALNHKHIDLLKIDRLSEPTTASDVLWYITKDKLLDRTSRVHVAIHIDKIDDDYLYGWYRALYNLFSNQGFRLYHMTTSHHLCLQVSQMAACVYYLSWISNPGPFTFILYPPAIDGSQGYEEQRIVDYITQPQITCTNPTNAIFTIQGSRSHEGEPVALCNKEKMSIECHVIVIVDSNTAARPRDEKLESCSLLIVKFIQGNEDHLLSVLYQKSPAQYHGSTLTIPELMSHMKRLISVDFLFLDVPRTIWSLLTPLLNSPVLQSVQQIIIDAMLWTDAEDKHTLLLRQRYSELKRLESHGFSIFHTTPFHSFRLKFLRTSEVMENCCFQVSYLNNRHLLRYS